MPISSVDDLVVAVENSKLAGLTGQNIPVEVKDDPVSNSSSEPEAIEPPSQSDEAPSSDETASEPLQSSSNSEEKEQKQEVPRRTDEEKTHDEYGNEVIKAQKTYTEEEVQRMIRERLARGQHAQQQAQQQAQQAAKDFTPDPNSTDSWEVQLENFVNNTLEKREQKARADQQRAHDNEVQARFEEKFNAGMGRYRDFKDVVSGKPITDAMMMAARSMDDPAAFIYAASKNHAKELESIARLPDPYAQVAAIGRLEEKMRKVKNMTSAPKPVQQVKGDMVDKPKPKRNIDDRIDEYARTRRR